MRASEWQIAAPSPGLSPGAASPCPRVFPGGRASVVKAQGPKLSSGGGGRIHRFRGRKVGRTWAVAVSPVGCDFLLQREAEGGSFKCHFRLVLQVPRGWEPAECLSSPVCRGNRNPLS